MNRDRIVFALVSDTQTSLDEGFKASAYLAETFILNDATTNSFQRAFEFPGNFFEFSEKHPGYMGRVQAGFAGTSKLEPTPLILKGIS